MRSPSSADLPTEALAAGTMLHSGAFCIEDVLSQSNFAITYRGRDTRLERAVAIKEYFPLGCSRQQGLVQARTVLSEEFERAKNQFLDEAKTLAQFRHPGIVAVFDFFAENNTTYMVMEFLAGQTLEARLENSGALLPATAIAYTIKIGEALQDVHDAALLHCDIKPGNVMVCPVPGGGERVVLVDFGLTKRLEESQNYSTRRLSDAGSFGTPGYAPIEQYTHSAKIGAYTDVYALGATLYRLLTGQAPPPASDRAAGAPWHPPHEINDQVPRSLSRVLEWAMQMSPAARPANVSQWLQRLRSVEEEEHLRRALIAVLRARLRHLQKIAQETPQIARSTLANRSTPIAPAQIGVRPEELPDDQGCLHACFVGCLVMWFIAASVAFMGWAVRFVLIGG